MRAGVAGPRGVGAGHRHADLSPCLPLPTLSQREPSPWPIGQAQDKHWLADWCSGRRCPDSNPGSVSGPAV